MNIARWSRITHHTCWILELLGCAALVMMCSLLLQDEYAHRTSLLTPRTLQTTLQPAQTSIDAGTPWHQDTEQESEVWQAWQTWITQQRPQTGHCRIEPNTEPSLPSRWSIRCVGQGLHHAQNTPTTEELPNHLLVFQDKMNAPTEWTSCTKTKRSRKRCKPTIQASSSPTKPTREPNPRGWFKTRKGVRTFNPTKQQWSASQ